MYDPFEIQKTKQRLSNAISYIWEISPTLEDYATILIRVLNYSKEEVIDELTCNCGEDEEKAYKIYKEAKECV